MERSSRCCCLVLFPKLEALSNFLYKLSNAIWPKSPTNCCKTLQIIVLWIMCHLKIINHKWCRRIVRVPYKIPCTREVVLLVASYYLDWYKVWRCGPLCVLSGCYVTTSKNRTRCFWSLTLFLASLGQRELKESEVSFGSCLRRFIPEHRSSCQTRREIQGVCCRWVNGQGRWLFHPRFHTHHIVKPLRVLKEQSK